MHLGMGCIRGHSSEEKTKLGLNLYNVNLWVENPIFVLCKERRVIIKLFFNDKYILASFLVQMAFVRIRLNFVRCTVCRTKRKKK